MREVVLVGGGHAHVEVLRRFGMDPPPDARLTLVSRETETVYSGMLPGTLAGHYDAAGGRIDLRPLARFARARLFHAEAVGLDPERRVLELRGRPAIPYDLLSLDVGAAPDVGRVPGAAEAAVPVKPIDRFLGRWDEVEDALAGGTASRIAVVGAGAGGVEVVLAVEHRLRSRGVPATLLLVTASPTILPEQPAGVRRRIGRILRERGIEVRTAARVREVDEGTLHLEGGGSVEADEVLWVTAAAAPDWPRAAGLETDREGFVLVDDALRSVSHPDVFAAGDVATMRRHPRPKAGVIAVRQGPPLAKTLRRVLEGREPVGFRPQRTFLTILSTGDRHAVASRGPLAVEGDWVWRVKDWIDRRWIRKYTDLPEMEMEGEDHGSAPAVVPAMRCAGCGGKVDAALLSRVLAELPRRSRPDVLSGLGAPDDGAVVRVPPGRVQVQSVDFFRDPIGDPYLLGRIAAVHALSDLHAMGAEPVSALALLTIPHGSPAAVEADLRQVLAGAARSLGDDGALLVGGHTAEGDSLAAGFAVTGTVDEEAITGKYGLRPDDTLVLTEPLGTGVVLAAEMRGRARASWVEEALQTMLRSNARGARVLREHGARAVTDVTGFGLGGHLLEMLRASDVGARVELDRVPVLAGAERAAAEGVRSSLHRGNASSTPELEWEEEAASDPLAFALHDPQTSGGLLAGIPPGRAAACVAELRARGHPRAAVVGSVTEAAGGRIVLRVGRGAGARASAATA